MKQTISFIVIVLMLCLLPVSAFALSYDVPETGAVLTIPPGWIQKALTADREQIDVKYETKSGLSTFMFGCTDVWGELSPIEKITISRAELNNDYIKETEGYDWLGDALGFQDARVKLKTISGNEYFWISASDSVSIEDLILGYDFNAAYRVDDGYMYMFLLYSFENETTENDLVEILKGFEYPSESTKAPSPSSEIAVIESLVESSGTISKSSGMDTKANNAFKALFAIVTIAVISFGTVFFVKKGRSNKKPLIQATGPIEAPAVPPVKPVEKSFCCSRCGKHIPPESKFCPYCGNKQNQ